MIVLIIPVGYTHIFSFLLNHTLAIPVKTATYSGKEVVTMPFLKDSKNSWYSNNDIYSNDIKQKGFVSYHEAFVYVCSCVL